MEERKGFLTPEQEDLLDDLLVLNNKIAESLDGIGIKLIDNQLLEALKTKLVEKYPDSLPLVYEIVDALLSGLELLLEDDDEE